MLSFKALTEKKKTPCKINPKLEDIKEKSCDTEGKKKCSVCDGEGCKHCGGTGYHSAKEKTPAQRSVEGKGRMTEAKKKDDTYLETDFKKRQKNNEKARKDLMKGPQMKNPHFESKWYDPMEDPDFDHDEAERTRGQSGKPAKKKTKKSTKKEEVAYVSQEEVSEESNQEIAETETLLTFGQFNEGRAEDAQASLAKVKARQKVLDAHEKKTGKKLDITKTPEHKAHKQNFPGAKRQEKKVKGAKETPSETQNRRIMKSNQRIVKHGYTSKEKKEVKAMAKHASRYD
jgi:hypothetical protein